MTGLYPPLILRSKILMEKWVQLENGCGHWICFWAWSQAWSQSRPASAASPGLVACCRPGPMWTACQLQCSTNHIKAIVEPIAAPISRKQIRSRVALMANQGQTQTLSEHLASHSRRCSTIAGSGSSTPSLHLILKIKRNSGLRDWILGVNGKLYNLIILNKIPIG